MSNEPTNLDRAAWAKDALAVFTAQTYSGEHPDTINPIDLQGAVIDLIADLLHLARQREFDTDAILQQAREHFELEVLEEGGRP